jgi:ATP-dependent DNA ligase
MKKTFPLLLKYTQKGQIQTWQITAEDDHFFTEEGIQGGTITTSKPTICKAKNVGRSNETTPEQQALAEAQAKWQKKIDGGYNEILTDEKKFFEPMLAHELGKYEKLLFTVPTFIQPKLDGLRAVNANNTLMSRNGKAYLAAPHLYQDKVTLDGELYNHKYHDDFNKIVSLCKKQTPTKEELQESKDVVQMWVYDFPDHEGKFSDRLIALKRWLAANPNPNLVLVPTYEVKNQKDIDRYHDQFLEMGFEGSIIRLDLGNYEKKRSKQLLKKKDFIDEEFVILDAIEGEGGRAGTIGYFVMKHDKKDKTFKSNVKGDFEYLATIWNERAKYIGTKATVKYFNRTPDDIPRFPYIIKLNREEYE